MIGASKILTVSYGTFSCTLEGFDDPFNTMKAIAEYFRDLAAGDRYFGAEPPTPDAAMLHQIAEREIQRRVEAQIGENGVTLRASDSGLGSPVRAAPAAPAPVVAPTLAPAGTLSVAESVAAKLSRLRAAAHVETVALAEIEDEVLLPDASLAGFLPEFVSDPADDAMVEVVTTRIVTAEIITREPEAPVTEAKVFDTPVIEVPQPAATAPSAPLPSIEANDPVELVEDMAETAVEPELEISPAPVESNVTPLAAPRAAAPRPVAPARPERPRADRPTQRPVPRPVPVPAPQADLPEDLPEDLAELLSDDEARALQEALGGTGQAARRGPRDLPAEEYDDELTAAEVPQFGSDAETDALLASLDDALPEAARTDTPDLDVAAQQEDGAAPDDLAALIATLTGGAAGPDATPVLAHEDDLPEDAAPDEDLAETDLPEDTAEAAAWDGDLAPRDDSTTADAGEAPDVEADAGAETRAETAERLQRARARVVKIRRGETAATMAPEDAPTIAPEALSPTASAAEAPIDAAADTQSENRKRLEAPTDDVAVNRLIAQTNSEMEGPENKRRLSAIAHLKAAVAATVADRLSWGKSSRPVEAEVRAEPYRDDLARAVRPKRPESSGAPAERPAPLVLVSEQRIDRPAAAPLAEPASPTPVVPTSGTDSATIQPAPVRPRRVAVGGGVVSSAALFEDEDDDEDEAGNLFTDSRGFAEFAERLGAESLSDMMEAAAAYTASVEGRPHFSRPHLMRHMSLAHGGELPREDSLRTFGRLLREGRIEKVKRGQFALSESSRFLVEARKLDG